MTGISGYTIASRCTGLFATNCYALIDKATAAAAIIDPGFEGEQILDELPEATSVDKILLTHGHFDHLAAAGAIARATGAKIGLHPVDIPLLQRAQELAAGFGLQMDPPPQPDFDIAAGQRISVGRLSLEVRHTPGHSPGGVAFVLEGTVIAGDTLFAGSIGRADLPGSDYPTLLDSVRTQLLTLPDETRILPGHGPPTTVKDERLTNPFLRSWQAPQPEN